MKNPRLLLFSALLVLTGCRDEPMPVTSMWNGTVELRDGISVPLRMNLDFSESKPAGYFQVADEKIPIPEITKNGDSVTLAFSEYAAEIKANWNSGRLSGNYLRIRSDGTKSLTFIASPETSSSDAAATAPATKPI